MVLGRINPDRPIGGKLDRLDMAMRRVKAIETAYRRTRSDLGIEDAAEAVLKLANAKMAGAIRLVSIEKGHDPAKFAAMPFGGGGALHTGALIKEVGLGSALVPRFPGVTSALGLRRRRYAPRPGADRQPHCWRILDAAALGRDMIAVAEETEALLRQRRHRLRRG